MHDVVFKAARVLDGDVEVVRDVAVRDGIAPVCSSQSRRSSDSDSAAGSSPCNGMI